MMNVNANDYFNADDYDSEEDEEYFEVKSQEEGEEEEGDEQVEGEGQEEEEGEGEEEEEEEEEEGDGFDEAEEVNENETEKIEENIFNEINLLHSIKAREEIEQKILVLFRNMLKRETTTIKEEKHDFDRNEYEEVEKIKEEDKELKEFGKSKLKMKNKAVFNFIYDKMNMNAKEKKKDENKKGSSVDATDESAKVCFIEKEHFILDRNVVTILHDINSYLHMEREYLSRKMGRHMDSTYKNPMYVTMYIFNSNILNDTLLHMVNIIKNDFDNTIYANIDEHKLVRNILILIKFLSKRPSKEWFEYWNKYMPRFNNKKSEMNVYNFLNIEKNERKMFSNVLKNDIYIKELQRRSNIIEQYQRGLQNLKCLLANRDFLHMLNEFRYNCQLFIDADYRDIEESEKVYDMERKEEELMKERKRLKEELESYREMRLEEEEEHDEREKENKNHDDDDDEEEDENEAPEGETAEGKVIRTNRIVRKKIKNIKKRMHKISEELHEVTTYLTEDKRKREELIQEYKNSNILVRDVLSQVLGIRNKGSSKNINMYNVHYTILQNMLDKHSALNLIIEEMTNLFKRELKKYGEEKNIHIPYLKQNTMKDIWDYVRLFYNIICNIDPIDLAKSLTYQKQVQTRAAENNEKKNRSSFLEPSRDKDPTATTNKMNQPNGLNELRRKSTQAPHDKKINYNYPKRKSNIQHKKNLMMMHLSRINPLLAKEKVRKPFEEKHMRKKKRRFIERKSLIDYYENCSFEDLSYNIFTEDSFKKYNILNIFDYTNLYKILEFLSNVIGINEEFEDPNEENEDEFRYSFKLFLNICIKDLRRGILENYNYPWDVKIILNIHSWIVTFYTNLYINENKKRIENSRNYRKKVGGKHSNEYTHTLLISRIQMLLGMQMYIGENSIHCEFLCETFQRLIKEDRMRKHSSKIILCCLRCLFSDLTLMDIHSVSTEEAVKSICKETLNHYLKRNIVTSLSWILKNFKILSHEKNIFIYSLKCILTIIHLLEKLGGTTYIVKEKTNVNEEDSDEDEEEDQEFITGKRKKKKKKKSGYNDENDVNYINSYNDSMVKIDVSDLTEEIYNGKIVALCMQILENFKRNSFYINDLIITYFELILKYKNNDYNFLMFFDIKYFVIFKEIINDPECTSNPKYFWIATFFENIISCFFKLWQSNSFLPIELFFSKDMNKTGSTLLSEQYMISMFSNYTQGNDHFIFEEMSKGVSIPDIFIELNSRKRLEHLEWSSEDITNLKIYFKQFRHIHNFLPLISEMLNKSTQTVKNQLIYMNCIDKKGNVIYDETHVFSESSGSSSSDEISSVESVIVREKTTPIKKRKDDVTVDETEEEAEVVGEEKYFLKQKTKQPMLYIIYKLKRLGKGGMEGETKDESILASSLINCNINSVLEEMNQSLKSMLEIKKLSKHNMFSDRAFVFDVPLSISTDLMEHQYFKKLLKLLEFEYQANVGEWVLKDSVETEIFKMIVQRFERLHKLSIEELQNLLYDIKDQEENKEDVKEEGEHKLEEEIWRKEKTSEFQSRLEKGIPNKFELEEEELYMLPVGKLKGTFKLLKLMYEYFKSNDEECKIFFNGIMNQIELKGDDLFKKKKENDLSVEGNQMVDKSSSSSKAFESHIIFLSEAQKEIIKNCYSKNLLENLLEYIGVFITKTHNMILSKHINEHDFYERLKIINNYKTEGMQELEHVIQEKEEQIKQKKLNRKEKKPTEEQKYAFIKSVCIYLYNRYYVLEYEDSQDTFNLPEFRETYFGNDVMLTNVYEKVHAWNNKRSKGEEDNSYFLDIEDLLNTFFGSIIHGTSSDEKKKVVINILVPTVVDICIALKGEQEGTNMKWDPKYIHREWLRTMLRVFYNILFDNAYNSLGKLFDEYKNIKEIVNDTSEEFLDFKKKKKKKEKEKEQTKDDTTDMKVDDTLKESTQEENEKNIKIDKEPVIHHKRKFDSLEEHLQSFKKRKLENTFINTYKRNRKSIIDSLLKNKNIFHYKESDLINRVKQIFIKAGQMVSNGELQNHWKTKEDVKRILLI